MLTEDKITEIFCMADDFCKFFDTMMAKYTIKSVNKMSYHRDSTMSKAKIMLIIILFHDSEYRSLKHFYLDIAAYCLSILILFTKKLWINVNRTLDTLLTLF